MKKIFTLSIALVAAASAYAVAPKQAAPVAIDSHKMMLMQSSDMVQPVAKMSDKRVSAAVTKSATAKALPSGATGMTHYYTNPASAYFAQNTFAMGSSNYSYPIMVLPAYANNVWENWSYYFDSTGQPAIATGDFSYVWNYWDFDFYEASSTDENLEVMNQPYIIKGMMMDAPALTVDADTVYMYDGAVIYGGNGDIPQYMVEGAGMTSVNNAGLRPFDLFSEDLLTIGGTGCFGTDANATGDDASWLYAYSSYPEFKVNGIAQVFQKPAAPYALSNISFYAHVDCAAGAELDVTFYRLDDEGSLTNEVIAEKTYKFTEAYSTSSSGYYHLVSLDFTTEDEYGFELDYQMIDCGMAMVISGYESSLFEYYDTPVVFFTSDTPSTLVEPNLVYALCSFNNNGETVTGLASFPFSFYGTNYGVDFMECRSMNILMKLEYPYLQTCEDLVAASVVPVQGTYDVSLAAGEYAVYAAYCSGSAEDIVVSEYPEWLQVEVADRTQDVSGMTGEYVEVAFAVADNATAIGESCDLVLSYKGCTQTYHITLAAAGVDNVAKDNVEVVAVEYYNIQGQKLNVAPENGIFIQKNIKADGSVNNVKVVK